MNNWPNETLQNKKQPTRMRVRLLSPGVRLSMQQARAFPVVNPHISPAPPTQVPTTQVPQTSAS